MAQDVAIVRVEQLAPFPFDSLADATIGRYPNAELVWVQEEPKNSGAWSYVQVHTILGRAGQPVGLVANTMPWLLHSHG